MKLSNQSIYSEGWGIRFICVFFSCIDMSQRKCMICPTRRLLHKNNSIEKSKEYK